MANEKLSSSVYFRGSKMNSADFTILDSSKDPSYTVTILDPFNLDTPLPDLKTVGLSVSPVIILKQTPAIASIRTIYFKLSGANAARFKTSPEGTVSNGVRTGSLQVSQKDNDAVITLTLDHYPCLTDSNALLEFFHDSAMTRKITSLPVFSKKITNPKLRVTSLANKDNPNAPLGIYNNDTIYIEYSADDLPSLKRFFHVPFTMLINGKEIKAGNYPDTGGSWIQGQYENWLTGYGNGAKGTMTQPRQKNYVTVGNFTITIKMGDIEATNNIMDSENGYLLSNDVETTTNTTVFHTIRNVLPTETKDINDPDLCFGWSFQKAAPCYVANPAPKTPPRFNVRQTTNYCPLNLTIDKKMYATEGLKVKATAAVYTDQYSNKLYVGSPVGSLDFLSWNFKKLDTLKKREQFGKYQWSGNMVMEFVKGEYDLLVTRKVGGTIPNFFDNGDVSNSKNRVVKLADINNPISTAKYGALTKLDYQELAMFGFCNAGINIQKAGIVTNFVGTLQVLDGKSAQFYLGTAGTTPQGTPIPPKDPNNPNYDKVIFDVLVLRVNGTNEKNTFSADTPYPRIVNVQTMVGYGAWNTTPDYSVCWDFTIDPSLGIDLTDEKYQFMIGNQSAQIDYGQPFIAATLLQSIELIAKSKHKLVFSVPFPGVLYLDASHQMLSVAVVETQAKSIPGSRDPWTVKCTLSKPNGTDYCGALASSGQITDDKSISNNFVYKLYEINAVIASNGTKTSTVNGGFVYLSDGKTDGVYTKPDTIYLHVDGEVFKYTRTKTSGDPADDKRYGQKYTLATASQWDSIRAILNASVTTPKKIQFSLFDKI